MEQRAEPRFVHYVGIDYSGAETPTSSLPGLRVYQATRTAAAVEVIPPPGPRKYWTRRGIAEWLVDRLAQDAPTIVGIDHGFSFPLAYFEAHGLPRDWHAFLVDFHRHWPTDGDDVYVDFVRDGTLGAAAIRSGNTRWRRLTELRTGAAKSVFHFDVQGSVAKSTHSGLPWLLFLREHVGPHLHFWPFDGWDVPAGRSAVVEVYPALWARAFAAESRTSDQHDAYVVAERLRQADASGELETWLMPALTPDDRKLAEVEGWILGVSTVPAREQRNGVHEKPVMARPMGKLSNKYGSELHLLRYLGRHRRELDRLILAETGGDLIEWQDHPFGTADGMTLDAELRGLEFLGEAPQVQEAWAEFWPQGHGIHNWDAVGLLRRGQQSEWLLVEAKAHVEELASHCQASPASRARIARALDATKVAFGVPPDRDWLNGYYQYCNRLAALYFLEKNGIQARLLFIYFVGDRQPGRECPQSPEGWRAALVKMEAHIGRPAQSRLSQRVHKVFVPVRQPR